VVDRPATLKDD